MNEENPKVIAVFDVLGFSNKVTREGLSTLLSAYTKLTDIAEKYKSNAMLNCGIPIGDNSFGAAFGIFDIEHDYFSDTVILWCSYNTFCFPPFCDMCNTFICEVIETSLPIRGGIAVGEAYMDKTSRKYLGKAFLEAVSVEKSQDWIGASFGPSFAKDPYNSYFISSSVLVYRKHTKPGQSQYIPGVVLDWPRKWRDRSTITIGRHLKTMNNEPAFAKYYENTLSFTEFSEINKDWPRTGKISTE
jgi:hypothetical protein